MRRTRITFLMLAAIGGCTPLVIEQRHQEDPAPAVVTRQPAPLPPPPPTATHWNTAGEQPALATRNDAPALMTATTNPDGTVTTTVTAKQPVQQLAQAPLPPAPLPASSGESVQQFVNKNKITQVVAESKNDKPSAIERADLDAKAPAPLVPPPNSIDLAAGPVAQQPAFRMVNTKKFTLNFEVKEVGVTGISTVELWCTQDMRTWKKLDSVQQVANALLVEVKDEGTYGFTLVAHNGNGLGKSPPQAGELPQVWVSVNTTPPAVALSGVEMSLTSKAPSLIIRWTAKDRNFGPRPVTLSYATSLDGPWTLLAANVDNNGRYEWPLPGNVPASMYVRVQAADLNGNVGYAQTENPIHLESCSAVKPETLPEAARPTTPPPPAADPARPTVSITAVEPNQQ